MSEEEIDDDIPPDEELPDENEQDWSEFDEDEDAGDQGEW